MNEIYSPYIDFIQNREEQGLRRTLKATTPVAAGKIIHEGVTYIDFSSNDYLGLKHHPQIIARAQEILHQHGAGAGASRAVTGHSDLTAELETKIAMWKGAQSALVMAGGFHCNASVLPALFDKDVLGTVPLVFTDKLIHASMHHGCITAGVKQVRFAHNDMNHLRQLLDKYKDDSAPKFILTESVFSMDGDIAPLDTLYELRDQYQACLVVDEAHATGIFGDNGKGLADKADIIIGTCGKALGSFGAYVAADKTITDYLIQNCKGFIYSTALPPVIIASIEAAIDLLPNMAQERQHVLNLSRYFREELKRRGLDCGASGTQIVPMIIGDIDKTMAMSATLKEQGFWATAIRPPTVPPNTSRIRFAFSAAHNMEDVEQLVKVIQNA